MSSYGGHYCGRRMGKKDLHEEAVKEDSRSHRKKGNTRPVAGEAHRTAWGAGPSQRYRKGPSRWGSPSGEKTAAKHRLGKGSCEKERDQDVRGEVIQQRGQSLKKGGEYNRRSPCGGVPTVAWGRGKAVRKKETKRKLGKSAKGALRRDPDF